MLMMKSLLLSCLILMPCLGQSAPPPKVVTNYVYTYYNQTNWIYNTTVQLQTNYVYNTNYVFTTNTVFNFINTTNWVYQTNFIFNTNYVFTTNTWSPPPTNLTLTNLSVVGFLFVSNSTPGLIQTFNGSNITGHLP